MTRFGLRARLVLLISVLILIIAAFFAYYFPKRQEEAAVASLETKARAITTIMAERVAPAVEFENQDEAQKQLGAVSGINDLLYLTALKTDGTVFARYTIKGLPGGVELLQSSNDVRLVERDQLLHVFVPLRTSNATVGTLVAGYSQQGIAAARTSSLNTALFISAIMFLVGLGAAWALAASVTRPVVDASRHLQRLSQELVSAVRAQEASGAEQAAAIEETRRTMEMLLGSAQQIADSSSTVLDNAERTVQGNRDVAQRIRELNTHAEKVAEILASIMQVADRTDLLALNAALEGTKAGEAGRGFALVAAEMRRLAESVMESVTGIRRLLSDVRTSSQSAVQAGQEGISLSEQTKRSAGDIAIVTQQQRKATEQVGRSMDEMAGAVNNTMASTRQAARAAGSLSELSGSLTSLIGRATEEHADRA